ncbi:MAG TPA: aminopeptidase P family protein [Vicinamibacterales bacterium]|nr:aminopeptidase P family protein [Vicinamibacterales bacterium]
MFDAQVYVGRRNGLQRQFQDGLLLFVGNADAPMNYAANAYHFRQDSSFLYYWGVDDPDLVAVLDVDAGRHVIYGDDFTVDDIVWRGPQPTIAERAGRAGVTETLPLKDLPRLMSEALRAGRRIHFLPQYRADNAQLLERLLGIRAEAINEHASVALCRAVVSQRAIKSAEEIAEIERALEISRDMHVLAMRMAKPGMYEREVAGAMEGLVASRGVAMAFPVIFSVHGETLHNHYHGNRMEAGQMAVNDSGAESPLHYASDITRTIPIGGRFEGPQRDLYQAVHRAQKKAIAAVKPGVKFRDVHLLACRSLAEDLKTMGLMKGNLDAAIEQGAQGMFFQCGLGHMLGLDVHDMEGLGEQHVGYDASVQRSAQFGLKSLRMARPLEPGMVMTVEPGIYMIPVLMARWRAEGKFAEFLDYDAIERFRAFGGIRLEDDVLVTETGNRVLGQPIPIEMEEVEALARQ